jgi:hypothetical protein
LFIHPFFRGKQQPDEPFVLFAMPPWPAGLQPQNDLDEVPSLQQALVSPLIFFQSRLIVIINASPTRKQTIMVSIMILPPE